jgi:molybdate transport system substrate-binding protein
MATRELLAELAALHEGRTGQRVILTAIGGVDAARRVRAGEPTDVVVLAAGAMQALAAEGHIVPASLAPVAVSGMAVAVPVGAPRPDITTKAALRDAVLAAGRIGYSTGPSGDHLLQLLRGWGVLHRVERHLVKAPPGVPVAQLLADGDAALGFQQFSELVGKPGIVVLGLLPEAVQALTIFTAGVASATQQPEAARALIEALTGADAHAVLQRHGMQAA